MALETTTTEHYAIGQKVKSRWTSIAGEITALIIRDDGLLLYTVDEGEGWATGIYHDDIIEVT